MLQLYGIGGIVRDSQQPSKTVREIQQLHGDSERQPATTGKSETHAATLRDRIESERLIGPGRNSERQQATI